MNAELLRLSRGFAGGVLALSLGCASSPPRPPHPHLPQLQVEGAQFRDSGRCVPVREWQRERRQALETCFQELPEGAAVRVRLAREDPPFWTLDVPAFQEEQERRAELKLEPLPSCLLEVLKPLPAPRELIFLLPQDAAPVGAVLRAPEHSPRCYRSVLELGTDRFPGKAWGFEWERMRERFEWGTSAVHADFDRWLDAWLLTAFLDPEKGAVKDPVLVPERDCRACLSDPKQGDRKWLELTAPTASPHSAWPSASPTPLTPPK